MKSKYLLWLFFALQIIFWFATNRIKPQFIITPYPPTALQMQALSFGDMQLYYRKLGFDLQNAGDKYGHYTSFRDHDYQKLRHWFEALDAIDANSEFIPFIAAYYYSMVPDESRIKIIAEYITDYAKKDPSRHWRLLTTAAHIYHKYPQNSRAKLEEIGNTLSNLQDIPLWARVLTAFYLNDNGEICSAYDLVTRISQDNMLTAAENTQDSFLTSILRENIKRLQNTSKSALIDCAKASHTK